MKTIPAPECEIFTEIISYQGRYYASATSPTRHKLYAIADGKLQEIHSNKPHFWWKFVIKDESLIAYSIGRVKALRINGSSVRGIKKPEGIHQRYTWYAVTESYVIWTGDFCGVNQLVFELFVSPSVASRYENRQFGEVIIFDRTTRTARSMFDKKWAQQSYWPKRAGIAADEFTFAVLCDQSISIVDLDE